MEGTPVPAASTTLGRRRGQWRGPWREGKREEGWGPGGVRVRVGAGGGWGHRAGVPGMRRLHVREARNRGGGVSRVRGHGDGAMGGYGAQQGQSGGWGSPGVTKIVGGPEGHGGSGRTSRRPARSRQQ